MDCGSGMPQHQYLHPPSCSCYSFLYGQVGEKLAALRLAHFQRMANAVAEERSLRPVDVALLGAVGMVLETDCMLSTSFPQRHSGQAGQVRTCSSSFLGGGGIQISWSLYLLKEKIGDIVLISSAESPTRRRLAEDLWTMQFAGTSPDLFCRVIS